MAGKIRKTLKSKICAVMVALALAGGAREARGTLSNSIVKDNIEYYIQTDKAVYDLGEDVELLYRITNWRNETWEVGAIGSTMDIVVSAKDGEEEREVWMWHWYRGGHGGPVEFKLEPGEAKEIRGIWPQVDYKGTVMMDDDSAVSAGTYRVEAIFKYSVGGNVGVTEKPVALDIAVVPEPGSFGLFALGVLCLRRHSKRRIA